MVYGYFKTKLNNKKKYFLSVFVEVMITVLHNERSNVNQKFCAKSFAQ